MEKNRKQLLFGAAYYDEYMPYERLGKDVEMMKRQVLIPFGLRNLHGVPASRRKACLISHM